MHWNISHRLIYRNIDHKKSIIGKVIITGDGTSPIDFLITLLELLSQLLQPAVISYYHVHVIFFLRSLCHHPIIKSVYTGVLGRVFVMTHIVAPNNICSNDACISLVYKRQSIRKAVSCRSF